MSNRERIARAAEEARLAEVEKAAKGAAKETKEKSPTRSKRAPKAAIRMKIVWEVWSAAGKLVSTFPYAEKAAAEAETEALTRSKGKTHVLKPNKVPME